MLKPRSRRPLVSSGGSTVYSDEDAQRDLDLFCRLRNRENEELHEKRKGECWGAKLASLAQSARASSTGADGSGSSSSGGAMASSAFGSSSAAGMGGLSAAGASGPSSTEKNKVVAGETSYEQLAKQRIRRLCGYPVMGSMKTSWVGTQKQDFEEIWGRFGGTAQPVLDWCREENRDPPAMIDRRRWGTVTLDPRW